MKGKSKYIVPLLLAGVTATAGVLPTIHQHPQSVVHAEEQGENQNSQQEVTTPVEIMNMNGAEIRMTGGFKDSEGKQQDTFKVGSPITMPTIEVAENEGAQDEDKFSIVYKIYRGTRVVKEIKDSDADKTFTPSYTGAYNVVITAEKSGVIVSELKNLTIMVEKAEAAINLPVNSKYVIPAQLPVSNEKGLTIPAPTVTVTEDGEDEELTAAEADLKVKLITPNASLGNNGTVDITDTHDSETNTYKVDKSLLGTAGTYQIRYEYYDSTALVSKLETNFQVVKNLETPKSLYLKLNGSIPSTGNVNTEISIPKVTVLDAQGATDGITAHVTIKVIKIANNGDEEGSWEIDYENYTFTPEQEGNYVVTYEADLDSIYPGVRSTLFMPATIIKVTDDKNPTVRPTYAYEVNNGKVTKVNGEDVSEDAELDDLLVNRKVNVPSIAVRKDGVAKFKLPAIYGTDNKDGYSDLTFTREIVGNNISKITIDAPANEVSEEISLSKTGNYEIRYIATDKAGNKIRATYSLVVKDAEDVKNGETKVNLNIGVTTVSNKDTLRFSVPTATDTYDSNLDITTKYVIYDSSDEIVADIPLEETNSDGKYEIVIKDILTTYANEDVKYIKVFATATADSTLLGSRDKFSTSTSTTEEKRIDIVDTSSDTKYATLTIGGAKATADSWNEALLTANSGSLMSTDVDSIGKDGYAYDVDGDVITVDGEADSAKLAAFDQGKKTIKLPEIVFNDADENLRITLTIVDRFGNVVTKESHEKITRDDKPKADGTYDYVVNNAEFRLSASGIYTVTYRAQDTAGNAIVKSFGIRVNDKTAPTIVIDDEDKYGKDIEVGEFFEVPYGTLIKDGETVDGKVNWTVTYSAGAQCEISSTGFTPLTDGTFYVTYTGTDLYENTQILQDNSLFYVNAKDTTAPVFNDDSSYILPPTMAWDDEKDEIEVDIPLVYATDPIKNESVDVVYTVTSPDGTKVKVQDHTDSNKLDRRYFVATAQGVYTVTYEATDSANNKVTMTKQVAIGDCEAPTITWTDDYEIETQKKLGDKLELKLKYLELADNVTAADKLEDKMTITLVKPDGTTKVTNNGTDGVNYEWNLEETGAYTLKIVVKDEAGMSNTYRYTINVAAEEVEDKKISSVVGTVLVVTSVVILAGVVTYFVVSSHKKGTNKSSKNK